MSISKNIYIPSVIKREETFNRKLPKPSEGGSTGYLGRLPLFTGVLCPRDPHRKESEVSSLSSNVCKPKRSKLKGEMIKTKTKSEAKQIPVNHRRY